MTPRPMEMRLAVILLMRCRGRAATCDGHYAISDPNSGIIPPPPSAYIMQMVAELSPSTFKPPEEQMTAANFPLWTMNAGGLLNANER